MTSACNHWDPIIAHMQDTPETLDQIYFNNIKREAYCDGA